MRGVQLPSLKGLSKSLHLHTQARLTSAVHARQTPILRCSLNWSQSGPIQSQSSHGLRQPFEDLGAVLGLGMSRQCQLYPAKPKQ